MKGGWDREGELRTGGCGGWSCIRFLFGVNNDGLNIQ